MDQTNRSDFAVRGPKKVPTGARVAGLEMGQQRGLEEVTGDMTKR